MNLVGWIFWVSVGYTVLSIPFICIVMFMGWGVLKPYLKSRMRKAPLILIERSDGQCGFITGKYSEGTLDTDKYGSFFVIPKAFKRFYGTVLARAYERVGHTPEDEFTEASGRLYAAGIPSYNSAKKMLPRLLDKLRRKKFDKRKTADVEEKRRLEQAVDDISLIFNYFKFKLNPSQINEKITNAVRRRQKKDSRNLMMALGLVAVVIMAICVGGMILYKQMQCADCNSVLQTGLKACQVAKAAASSVV